MNADEIAATLKERVIRYMDHAYYSSYGTEIEYRDQSTVYIGNKVVSVIPLIEQLREDLVYENIDVASRELQLKILNQILKHLLDRINKGEFSHIETIESVTEEECNKTIWNITSLAQLNGEN